MAAATERMTHFDRLAKFYQGLGKGVKNLVPFALLILFIVLTTLSFYAIQFYTNDATLAQYGRYQQGMCVDAHNDISFTKAFYFVNTVFSSIGYGNVIPCTWPGKLLTVITALVGMPLNLFCLGKLGQYMAHGANRLWRLLRRHSRARQMSMPSPAMRRNSSMSTASSIAEAASYLPLPIGILVTVAWIMLSSIFFALVTFHDLEKQSQYVQDHWNYLDAVYYTIISLFTIGFGDYYPNDHTFDVLTFLFIFVGLSLVSMCIALATKRVETQMDKVLKMIQKAYEKSSSDGIPVHLSEDDEKMAKLILGMWGDEGADGISLNSPSPGFLSPFGGSSPRSSAKRQVGTYMTKLVIDKWKHRALKHTISTQTEPYTCSSCHESTTTANSAEKTTPNSSLPTLPPIKHRASIGTANTFATKPLLNGSARKSETKQSPPDTPATASTPLDCVKPQKDPLPIASKSVLLVRKALFEKSVEKPNRTAFPETSDIICELPPRPITALSVTHPSMAKMYSQQSHDDSEMSEFYSCRSHESYASMAVPQVEDDTRSESVQTPLPQISVVDVEAKKQFKYQHNGVGTGTHQTNAPHSYNGADKSNRLSPSPLLDVAHDRFNKSRQKSVVSVTDASLTMIE